MRPIIKSLKQGNQIDVNIATKEQLYKFNRQEQNNLNRRLKTIKQRVKEHPEAYSPFGLKAMEGYIDAAGNKKEGIPKISKKDSLNQQRVKAKKLMELNSMRTTRVQGAKDVQREQIRLSIGLPTKGKLNTADTRLYNEAVEYVKQNPDYMSDFWNGFQEYKRESMARNMDSDRLLEEYRPVMEDTKTSGYQSMDDIASIVRDFANEKYKESQVRSNYAEDMLRSSKWNEGE